MVFRKKARPVHLKKVKANVPKEKEPEEKDANTKKDTDAVINLDAKKVNTAHVTHTTIK